MKTIRCLLMLLPVLAGGCDRMRGQKGGEEEGKGGGETILVGEFGSFTGSEATFGQSTHNGLMLAVKEINAAGGVKGKKSEGKGRGRAGTTQRGGPGGSA